MLDTLIALTRSEEFEDSGDIRVSLVQRAGDGMELVLFVDPGDGSNEQRWRVECSGARDHVLRDEFAYGLRVVTEHPVLLPFTKQVTQLYFYNASPNPMATVGALFERHREIVGDWIRFERFLNVLPKGLSQLLATSSGQLAAGPVSLLEAYSRVLETHGIRSSMLPGRPPTYWDGEAWVEPSIPLRALILENSYVVAEKFEAEKLAG